MCAGTDCLKMRLNPGEHILQLQSGLFSILLLKLLRSSTAILSRSASGTICNLSHTSSKGISAILIVVFEVFADIQSILSSQASCIVASQKHTTGARLSGCHVFA